LKDHGFVELIQINRDTLIIVFCSIGSQKVKVNVDYLLLARIIPTENGLLRRSALKVFEIAPGGVDISDQLLADLKSNQPHAVFECD
jgi:hypothetical protein